MDPKKAGELALAHLKRFVRQDPSGVPNAKRLRSGADPIGEGDDFVSLESSSAAAAGKPGVVTIPINDSVHRVTLTKGSVQQQIIEETGAVVVSKGLYRPPGAMEGVDFDAFSEPPLYLHVSSNSQASVDAAVAQIRKILEGPPPTADASRCGLSMDVPIPFMQGDSPFPFSREIIGPQGSHIKHIETKTGARVVLRSQGPRLLHITAPNNDSLQAAASLARSLLSAVERKFNDWLSSPPLPDRKSVV